jgi:hypothetical protein
VYQSECVLRPAVLCLASQFFSALVRKFPAEVRRARYVPGSVVPCIPRARLRPVRVRSESVQVFRLRGQLVPAPVPVRLHAGRASATSRVA